MSVDLCIEPTSKVRIQTQAEQAAELTPSGVAAAPQPRSWLDVVEPVALFFHESLRRFPGVLRSDAELWLEALQAQLPVVQHTLRGGRFRAFRDVVYKISEVAGHQQALQRLLQDSSDRRRAAAAAAQRSSQPQPPRLYDPSNLPGHLRLGGPRHDNDEASIGAISIPPTGAEVLCREDPYLPHSR